VVPYREIVFARLRSFLTPGWVLLHLLTVALVVTMVLLGRWQLDVSNSKHFNLQNFAYALQWWLFSGFALWMWLRIVHDRGASERAGPQAAEPADGAHGAVAYRRYVMPRSTDVPAVTGDPELSAYNDYLGRLAERGEGTGG
jgi:DNA-binding transcriptional regulator of glucitol operon